MKNYDKPWTEYGGPNLEFYFDSYDLLNTLNKHSKPELYDCYDKGDEFGRTINFENIEHLKDFFKHLVEITELSSDEIFRITENNVWDGTACDMLEERGYTSEQADRLMDEVGVFIEKNAK